MRKEANILVLDFLKEKDIVLRQSIEFTHSQKWRIKVFTFIMNKVLKIGLDSKLSAYYRQRKPGEECSCGCLAGKPCKRK